MRGDGRAATGGAKADDDDIGVMFEGGFGCHVRH